MRHVRRLLLLGASGQLGTELCSVFEDSHIIAPNHHNLAVEDTVALCDALDREVPDLVINCSAFHNVDECERNPERAFQINAIAVGKVSAACGDREIPFATVSTDYVFSGNDGRSYDEWDRPEPVNVYGASKLAGEHLANLSNPNTFVFRVSGLFGRSGFTNKGPTFVERMIGLAEREEPINVVDNIVFSPSYAVHVGALMRTILEREEGGTFHITNTGECSWYDFALECIRAAGLHAKVQRSSYRHEPGATRRPLFSVLSHGELRRRKYAEQPTWQDAVSQYVSQRIAGTTVKC